MAAEPNVDLTSRESIIAWLCWCDRHGCFTDEDCDLEGMPRLTLETARAIYDEIVGRDS